MSETIRTGYNINSVEDISSVKEYGIIGSSLSGTDTGIEFHANVKIGEEDGRPLIATYNIYIEPFGAYSHGITRAEFDRIGYPEKNFNCYRVIETVEFEKNSSYSNLSLGHNGYRCIGIPLMRTYDKSKVKATAFRCLEKHYKPELLEIISLLKPVELMKVTPDERFVPTVHEINGYAKILKGKGISQKIENAAKSISYFYKEPEKPKEIQDIKKEIYFGFTQMDQYSDKIILEGKRAVAKFICNPQFFSDRNKVITNLKNEYILITEGMQVSKFSPNVRTKDRNEFLELIEEEKKTVEEIEEREP